MIQQPQQTVARTSALISKVQQAKTQQQCLNSYQEIVNFLSNQCRSQDYGEIIKSVLNQIQSKHVFESVFYYQIQRLNEKGQSLLQNSLLQFLIKFMQKSGENDASLSQKKKVVLQIIMQSKDGLLSLLTQRCRFSQSLCRNILFSANEMLVQKMRLQPIMNINFTFTSLIAFNSVNSWRVIDGELLEEAIRHLIIVDLIQKGQISNVVFTIQHLLDRLLQIGQLVELRPYYLCFVAGLINSGQIEQQNLGQKITQLQQIVFKRIRQTIDKEADLAEQIYKVLHSDKNEKEKKFIIQNIRSFSIFVSSMANKQLMMGCLSQTTVSLIEQMMGIQDFLSFQFLSRVYALIIKSGSKRELKLPQSVVLKIQHNSLPLFKVKQNYNNQYDIAHISFLANQFQTLEEYEVSVLSAQSMTVISDKILSDRGCISKPSICKCYDQYIHNSIEKQYDQQFNQHQFLSVTHIMCRQIERVKGLNPNQQQLQNLKEYLLNNIKWLLNLNESCLPANRKCINSKIFDLILAFPYILTNNEFLETVTCDLLIQRVPLSFYSIHKFVMFLKVEEDRNNKNKNFIFQRISEKILEKSREEGLTFNFKIEIWNLIILIWKGNKQKLDEFLQLYSLHEEHWIAKYCAAKHQKIKLQEVHEQKALQIIQKMQRNLSFYRNDFKLIQIWAKTI